MVALHGADESGNRSEIASVWITLILDGKPSNPTETSIL
jgi:hypothetical protein